MGEFPRKRQKGAAHITLLEENEALKCQLSYKDTIISGMKKRIEILERQKVEELKREDSNTRAFGLLVKQMKNVVKMAENTLAQIKDTEKKIE